MLNTGAAVAWIDPSSKSKTKPNTPLIEKPLVQLVDVSRKQAVFIAEVPTPSLTSGKNLLKFTQCRGGGNRYVVELTNWHTGLSQPNWKVHRNIKQTDEGS